MEFDVINAIYAASVVFILFYIYKIPLSYFLIILGHLALVFLTNDVLFPMNYMPDQFKYFNTAAQIRENLDFIHYQDYFSALTVSTASLFFSLFPILIIESVFSIAIINFMLYAFLFIFLYKRNILIGNTKWVYLFYPSFALYAAIGARDTLILVFMILSVYQLYKGNTILSIVISLPLVFIKFQNFFILILSILLFKTLDSNKFFTLKNIFKILIVIAGLFVFIQFVSIGEINQFRYSMFLEDGGNTSQYIPISNYFDFAVAGLTGGMYMLFKPFLWETSNILQLVQSFENLGMFYLIYLIVKKLKKINNKFKYFLIIYFSIAMVIYGIVVFNFGTAARYKYTFIVVFIIFSMKLINDIKGKKI